MFDLLQLLPCLFILRTYIPTSLLSCRFNSPSSFCSCPRCFPTFIRFVGAGCACNYNPSARPTSTTPVATPASKIGNLNLHEALNCLLACPSFFCADLPPYILIRHRRTRKDSQELTTDARLPTSVTRSGHAIPPLITDSCLLSICAP